MRCSDAWKPPLLVLLLLSAAQLFCAHAKSEGPPAGIHEDCVSCHSQDVHDSSRQSSMCLGCHDGSVTGGYHTHSNHLEYKSDTLWSVTVSSGRARFRDKTFSYGHPAKLVVNAGRAYVECTTCHEIHGGRRYLLRGSFQDGMSFCRSCHYGMSLEQYLGVPR